MGLITWPFPFSISMRFHGIHSTTDSLPEAKSNIGKGVLERWKMKIMKLRF